MLPLPESVRAALQRQLTLERSAVAVYDNLADAMAMLNLPGAEKFFRHSAGEETAHAAKFAEYLIDRSVQPTFDPLPGATSRPDSLLSAFQLAQKAEAAVTNAIDELYDLADAESDNGTCVFLHWFVTEQIASERELVEIVGQITRAGRGLGEQWMDEQIGERGN